ncbi:hypothetical protein [Desulfuromonas sp. TF]|nr:hypothetical protein [Desulfuromonas sp. TF]
MNVPEEFRPPQKTESADLQSSATAEEGSEAAPFAVIWKDGEELRLY